MVDLKSVALKSISSKIGCDKNETTVATSYGNLSIDSKISAAEKHYFVRIFIEDISAQSFFSNTISEFAELTVVFHI